MSAIRKWNIIANITKGVLQVNPGPKSETYSGAIEFEGRRQESIDSIIISNYNGTGFISFNRPGAHQRYVALFDEDGNLKGGF